MPLDFAGIRRVAITALFSDDMLLERLVLKGGNALSLIYGLTSRTSLDLDFSMAEDFPDIEDARRRLFRALRNRFDAHGYAIFDEQLEPKPKLDAEDAKPWWDGYELRFKLIEKPVHERLKDRLEKLRIQALVTGTAQQRTLTVDLSKCEFTAGKAERELDYYTIYVYTPEMIAVEKLRAICQQMPEYEHRGRPAARARDFYDIHRILTKLGLNLATAENHELTQHVFAAKRVPLRLLSRIRGQREFHRPDWPAVVNTAGEPVEEFDFYFDSVLTLVEQLEPLWVEEPPL